MNVVVLPSAMISAPFGPRNNTPELRAALRIASIRDVRRRLSDHSSISTKTWALIGRELLDERKRAQDDGPKVFPRLFAASATERRDEARYPFSLATAYRLMDIANFDFRTLCEKEMSLPPSWGTLAVIVRIPPKDIFRFIDNGSIHPTMTRAEAAKLLACKKRKAVKAKRPPAALKKHFLSIKITSERAKAFLGLLAECGLTLENLEAASK